MGIVALNQLSGGAALAYFGIHASFLSFGSSARDIVTAFVYLNLLQLVVTLLAGQNI